MLLYSKTSTGAILKILQIFGIFCYLGIRE